MSPRAQSPQDLRPPRIRRGDIVAVPAPAGPVPREPFLAGVSILEARYRVVYDDGVFARTGFLAGDDARRAAELNRYLADPAVGAIYCARGGYGVMRILPALDGAALRRAPRLVVGFSDVTALLAWGHATAGVRGVHGPNVTQLAAVPEEDRQALWRLLEDAAPPGVWATGLTRVAGGVARGPLLGGNLETLSRLVGTGALPALRGAILFFEEVGERPYRIDRILTQLALAGVLDGVAGVVVGDLLRCEEADGSAPGPAEVVAERLGRLGVPVCLGLPVGHGARNRALPVGAPAVLDADRGTLELLEGAAG
jgi:muramoyltetrapeptide carboxypeptidase